MSNNGPQFYDNDRNFTTYMERRRKQENANDTLEKPVITELIGDVKGLNVLDLGSGDARFGIGLLNKGCESYTGVEGSSNMVKAAQQNLQGREKATVIHTLLEDWTPAANSYDLVISSLVLHYIEDLEGLFLKVQQTLKSNGRFVFSVEHPVITSTLQPSGLRTNWIVDEYFIEGFRKQQWLGGTVQKYHRTIEQYFTTLQLAGFTIEQLRESKPQRSNFLHDETYERRLRIPLFFFLAARKV